MSHRSVADRPPTDIAPSFISHEEEEHASPEEETKDADDTTTIVAASTTDAPPSPSGRASSQLHHHLHSTPSSIHQHHSGAIHRGSGGGGGGGMTLLHTLPELSPFPSPSAPSSSMQYDVTASPSRSDEGGLLLMSTFPSSSPKMHDLNDDEHTTMKTTSSSAMQSLQSTPHQETKSNDMTRRDVPLPSPFPPLPMFLPVAAPHSHHSLNETASDASGSAITPNDLVMMSPISSSPYALPSLLPSPSGSTTTGYQMSNITNASPSASPAASPSLPPQHRHRPQHGQHHSVHPPPLHMPPVQRATSLIVTSSHSHSDDESQSQQQQQHALHNLHGVSSGLASYHAAHPAHLTIASAIPASSSFSSSGRTATSNSPSAAAAAAASIAAAHPSHHASQHHDIHHMHSNTAPAFVQSSPRFAAAAASAAASGASRPTSAQKLAAGVHSGYEAGLRPGAGPSPSATSSASAASASSGASGDSPSVDSSHPTSGGSNTTSPLLGLSSWRHVGPIALTGPGARVGGGAANLAAGLFHKEVNEGLKEAERAAVAASASRRSSLNATMNLTNTSPASNNNSPNLAVNTSPDTDNTRQTPQIRPIRKHTGSSGIGRSPRHAGGPAFSPTPHTDTSDDDAAAAPYRRHASAIAPSGGLDRSFANERANDRDKLDRRKSHTFHHPLPASSPKHRHHVSNGSAGGAGSLFNPSPRHQGSGPGPLASPTSGRNQIIVLGHTSKQGSIGGGSMNSMASVGSAFSATSAGLGAGGFGGEMQRSRLIPLGRVATTRVLAQQDADTHTGIALMNGAALRSQHGSRMASRISGGGGGGNGTAGGGINGGSVHSSRLGDNDETATSQPQEIEGLDEFDAKHREEMIARTKSRQAAQAALGRTRSHTQRGESQRNVNNMIANNTNNAGGRVTHMLEDDDDAAVRDVIAKKRANRRKRISQIGQKSLDWIDGGIGTLVMTLATIFCLFGDDIRIITARKEDDIIYVILSTICFLLFIWEFLVFSLYREDYLLTFFFFLDLIACFSLIPDLTYVWDPFMSAIGQSESENQNLAVARAGRASRAGTRAGRLVRFIRLVRFLRVVKLYKYCGETEEERIKREAQEKAEELARIKLEQEEELIQEMDSEIGRGFSDYITKCVIVMVLFMMFLLPLLEIHDLDTTSVDFIQQIDVILDPSNPELALPSHSLFQGILQGFYENMNGKVLYLSYNNTVFNDGLVDDSDSFIQSNSSTTIWINNQDRINQLRSSEVSEIVGHFSVVWIEIKSQKVTDSLYNILTTIFVTILLAGGAAIFSKNANEMVIFPIERMFLFVTKLAANPLGKIYPTGERNQPLETQLLEQTFLKLAGLLQIGFGAAGAEVISHNMKGDYLDPMVPGRKIFAIFGFCDIRKFGVVTEALGQHVMIFVNQVADIIHELTHMYGGAANKNIGSAFLLVWKPTVASIKRMSIMKEQMAAQQLILMQQQARLLAAAGGGVGGYNGPRQETIQEDGGSDEEDDGSEGSTTNTTTDTPRRRSVDVSHTAGGAGQPNNSRRATKSKTKKSDKLVIATKQLGNNHSKDDSGGVQASSSVNNANTPAVPATATSQVKDNLQPQQQPSSSDKWAERTPRTPDVKTTTTTAGDPSTTATTRSTRSSSHSALPASTTTGGNKTSISSDHDCIIPQRDGSVLPANSSELNHLNPHLATISSSSSFAAATSATHGGGVNGGMENSLNQPAESSITHNASSLTHPIVSLGGIGFTSNGGGNGGSSLAPPHYNGAPRTSISQGNTRISLRGIESLDGDSNVVSPAPSPRNAQNRRVLEGLEENEISTIGDGDGAIPSGLGMSTIGSHGSMIGSAVRGGASCGGGGSSEKPAATATANNTINNDKSTAASSPAATPTLAAIGIDPSASPRASPKLSPLSSTSESIASTTSFAPSASPTTGGGGGSTIGAPGRKRSGSVSVEQRVGPMWDSLKHLADQSIVAFLSTIQQVAITRELAHWRSNTLMCKLLGAPPSYNEYRIDMGFGLHVGWGIEGAIGSIYKIDASYLSPNVNIASRLCGATKQYGLNLLISGPLYSLMQSEIQKRCRHIDCITVKGSKLPLDIYTFDVGEYALTPAHVVEQMEREKERIRQMELNQVNSTGNTIGGSEEERKRNEDASVKSGRAVSQSPTAGGDGPNSSPVVAFSPLPSPHSMAATSSIRGDPTSPVAAQSPSAAIDMPNHSRTTINLESVAQVHAGEVTDAYASDIAVDKDNNPIYDEKPASALNSPTKLNDMNLAARTSLRLLKPSRRGSFIGGGALLSNGTKLVQALRDVFSHSDKEKDKSGEKEKERKDSTTNTKGEPSISNHASASNSAIVSPVVSPGASQASSPVAQTGSLESRSNHAQRREVAGQTEEKVQNHHQQSNGVRDNHGGGEMTSIMPPPSSNSLGPTSHPSAIEMEALPATKPVTASATTTTSPKSPHRATSPTRPPPLHLSHLKSHASFGGSGIGSMRTRGSLTIPTTQSITAPVLPTIPVQPALPLPPHQHDTATTTGEAATTPSHQHQQHQPHTPKIVKPKVESGDFAPATLASICTQLQRGLSEDFIRTFNEGSSLYLKGHWRRAREVLEKFSAQYPNDKPAQVLLKFMSETNYVKPKDWKGFRKLTSK